MIPGKDYNGEHYDDWLSDKMTELGIPLPTEAEACARMIDRGTAPESLVEEVLNRMTGGSA